MSHYSYTSIDVGFDLRLHDMIVQLPEDITSVAYDVRGKTCTLVGTHVKIRKALTRAGYRVSGVDLG
jgi:hypothetical protein